jgi:dGTPase
MKPEELRKALQDKASALVGCLSSLRTVSSRRRDPCQKGEALPMPCGFASDEARLLSCKAFRVMDARTQVFSFPENELVRDRKVHVLEVVANAVVASEMLGLNTNLVRAAAIGHDMGHVPFGHVGEAWMGRVMGRPEFCHEVMGPIIAQHIERKGVGLNLTWDTMDAMMRHSGTFAKGPMSPEAKVLNYADKIAYLFHDANDIFVRMRYPISQELQEVLDFFGENQRERGSTVISALVVESAELGRVSLEHSEVAKKFAQLRKLMYEIYPRVTQQNVGDQLGPLLDFLTKLNVGDPFLVLALMTDRDVTLMTQEAMMDMRSFNRTTVSEIVRRFQEAGKPLGGIDLCDPDLNW